ncbi:uncharacterized protein CCOS01_07031 [Colletotrichum costaricense]|uniref:Uncharacterized protein n=1 Tax=Colletotrichum costaricense TaxID=1209916 RepID=A0AAJ0E2F1_9PEZI|nr:uncharacterized protein CCOS01_07031 [Colletotrichum costaricense]KAK1529197.1 hypothetical protein CCOS01_07031 [Colletotrichum costaricense]
MHAKRLRPIYADTDSSLRTTRRRGGKYNSTRVSARYRKHARTLIAATCSGDRGWEEGRESRPGWCGREEGSAGRAEADGRGTRQAFGARLARSHMVES